jgi:hypothetical protein
MRRQPRASEGRRRQAKSSATASDGLRALVRVVARVTARWNFKAALEQADMGTGADDAQEQAKPARDTASDAFEDDPE